MARFCRPNKTWGQDSRHPFFLVMVPFCREDRDCLSQWPLSPGVLQGPHCFVSSRAGVRHAETEPCLTKKTIRLLRLTRVLSGMHMYWEPWVMLKPISDPAPVRVTFLLALGFFFSCIPSAKRAWCSLQAHFPCFSLPHSPEVLDSLLEPLPSLSHSTKDNEKGRSPDFVTRRNPLVTPTL